jgi:PTH1 family peptidyl-tRNA hydrolase
MKPTLVLIGLGNPGTQYDNTRHNAGFQAIDVLSDAFGQGAWKESEKYQAWIQEARVVAAPVLLVKPMTYMNLSGESVRKLVEFYRLDAKTQIIVMTDDIDLPLGTLRFRKKGSAGTHNGLKSVVEQYGEEFPRMRIGIGPKPAGADLAAWVLSSIPADDAALLAKTYAELPTMIRDYVMELPPTE